MVVRPVSRSVRADVVRPVVAGGAPLTEPVSVYVASGYVAAGYVKAS